MVKDCKLHLVVKLVEQVSHIARLGQLELKDGHAVEDFGTGIIGA